MRNIKEMKADHELRMTVTDTDEKFIKPAEKTEFDLLTFNQKRELLWEEEKKKRRIWEEEHWVEIEGGNGYF